LPIPLLLRVLRPFDRSLVEDALNRYLEVLAPGVGRLNAEPFYANPDNVGLATGDDRALALFSYLGHDVYEAHLICDEPWRGKEAVRFGAAAVGLVFTACNASAIAACIPELNRRSRRVCRAIGGTPVADTIDSLGRRCIRYRLERATWEASLAA
jgi:hypothetical protein